MLQELSLGVQYKVNVFALVAGEAEHALVESKELHEKIILVTLQYSQFFMSEKS